MATERRYTKELHSKIQAGEKAVRGSIPLLNVVRDEQLQRGKGGSQARSIPIRYYIICPTAWPDTLNGHRGASCRRAASPSKKAFLDSASKKRGKEGGTDKLLGGIALSPPPGEYIYCVRDGGRSRKWAKVRKLGGCS